jgi:hypothetical protein
MQSPNTNPGNPGEKAYQMLWDCRFCGTTRLLGVDHRHCPNCGAPQDPEWRYFPSDADLREVTDPKYKYTGVDKICPFCQQPNSAAANFCKECGGDLSGAKQAAVRGPIDSAQVSGVRDDVVKMKFDAEQAAIKAKGRRKGLSRLQIALIAIVGLCLLLVGGYVVLSRSTYGTSVAVSDMSWQRIISVEQLSARSGSDWRGSVPGDAYNRVCVARDRCHTESERYVCGSENVDRGDGSFTRRDKYCTRNKQVCVPDSWCSYTVDRWGFARNITASGGPNDAPTWPNFTPLRTSGLGAERESGRKEVLNVVFKDESQGKTFTYNPPDYTTWVTFKPGQRYSVEVNRLEQVQWNTLKLLSAQ